LLDKKRRVQKGKRTAKLSLKIKLIGMLAYVTLIIGAFVK